MDVMNSERPQSKWLVSFCFYETATLNRNRKMQGLYLSSKMEDVDVRWFKISTWIDNIWKTLLILEMVHNDYVPMRMQMIPLSWIHTSHGWSCSPVQRAEKPLHCWYADTGSRGRHLLYTFFEVQWFLHARINKLFSLLENNHLCHSI